MPIAPDDPRADVLLPLLRRAGEAALARLRDGRVRYKDDGSKVTDADMAAHDVIVEGLSAAFPGETIVSEEGSLRAAPGDAPLWWVDPIDGTGAMTEGLAHWGPTICRVVGGKLDVGALHEPMIGRDWFAAAGGGAWCDGRRLAPEAPGERAAGRTIYLPSAAHRLPSIPWRGKLRGLGSSAVHLAQVAAGGGAAAIVPNWKPWDVGCGVLLVREAGRLVTDLEGQDLDVVAHPGLPLMAVAPTLRDNLVEAVRATLADVPGA